MGSLCWVPEGSLAGICWCHEMALELVCGADCWCNRHCKTSPVVLEGFWGESLAENRPKTDPQISGQTAFRYPALTVGCRQGRRQHGDPPYHQDLGHGSTSPCPRRPCRQRRAVWLRWGRPAGTGTGTIPTSGLNRKLKYRLKCWSVFGRFPAKLGPRISLNGSGSENGAKRT